MVAVVAGVGGYLFLKSGVPSVSAPAGFTVTNQTTEGGNTITTYSGTGTTQEAYNAFKTWMGGQGWQYRIDNGALGGYSGHLYEKGNEVAVVQATSAQVGQVTVVVISGPKPSGPPDNQLPPPDNVPHSYAGHFGINGYHNYRPPLESLPGTGTPLSEMKTYFEWESAKLADAGITWNRTLSPAGGQFSWFRIEKTQGNYDWSGSGADELVKAAQAKGINLLVLIHPDASWAQPGEPIDTEAFRTFMRKLVERYDDDGIDDMEGLRYGVKYWEIGNEPEPRFTPLEYYDLLKAAYEAAKGADPEAKILNGGMSPVYDPWTGVFIPKIVDFWDNVFALGGGEYIDILNVHYTTPEPAPPLENFINQWSRFQFQKDMWVTETGTYSGTPVKDGVTYPNQTEEYQAKWWVKHSSYGLAHGVTKLFWSVFYSTPDVTPPKPGNDWLDKAAMISSDSTPKLVYTTQKVMASKIDNFSSVQELRYSSTEGHYKFTVSGGAVYVLWGSGGVPAEISGTVSVTDIRGTVQQGDASQITLSDSPIFVGPL